MKRALLSALIIWSGVAAASTDALDQHVSLRSESDLVQALGLTLQHALATSEQGRESAGPLRRFAERELKTRREHLRLMRKRFGLTPPSVRTLAIAPRDAASYARAMVRNHTRLLELIEHGEGLDLSKDTRRLLEQLAQGARSEMPGLRELSQGRADG